MPHVSNRKLSEIGASGQLGFFAHKGQYPTPNRVGRDPGRGAAAKAFRDFGFQRVLRGAAREVPPVGAAIRGAVQKVSPGIKWRATGAVRAATRDAAREIPPPRSTGGGRDMGCGAGGSPTVSRYGVRRGRFRSRGVPDRFYHKRRDTGSRGRGGSIGQPRQVPPAVVGRLDKGWGAACRKCFTAWWRVAIRGAGFHKWVRSLRRGWYKVHAPVAIRVRHGVRAGFCGSGSKMLVSLVGRWFFGFPG